MNKLLRIILFGLTLYGSRVFGASGDERWDAQFFAPGFANGDIGARSMIYSPDGDIICGGNFSSVGGKSGTANLARWDGVAWHSVGGGIANATVYALAFIGQDLIVGGTFTSIQGQAITNLARWDGTNWSAIGGGVTGGSVRALAVQNGTLFVGGLFTSAGGNAVNFVASWDGASWSALSGGMQAKSPSSFAAPIQTLLFTNGTLYAGGRFYSAGGTAATNVARWTGTVWESLGNGAENGTDLDVAAMAANSSGQVFLGGLFRRAGATNAGFVAMWNGTNWENLGGGVSRPSLGSVSALSTRGSELFVGGNFIQAGGSPANGFARWDGSQWHAVLGDIGSAISLANNGSDVFANGVLTSVTSRRINGLVQINNSGASRVIGAGIIGNNPAVVRTVSTAGDKVQVGGYFDGQTRHLIAQWDGTNWSVLGNGLYSPFGSMAPINDIFSAHGTVYAAGQFLYADNSQGTLGQLVGNAWTNIGAGPPASGYAIVSRGRELFVGHGQGVSRWTGSVWTELGTGIQGAVYALAFVGSDLYAAGRFTNAGSTALRNIARWDGTNWSSVGSGVNGVVNALAVRQNDVYLGGQFTEAGGVPCSRVALWNGNAWSALGLGFSNGVLQFGGTNEDATIVYDLTIAPDGTLFAGGNFTTSGTNNVNFLAAWDGTNWTSVGSGLNYLVRDLACDGESLYVGGDFTMAGTNSSLKFARWQMPGEILAVSALVSDSVFSGSNLTYTIKVKNAGDASVSGVEMNLPVPRGTTFQSASIGGIIVTNVVSWRLDALSPDEERILTVTVNVTLTAGIVMLRDYFAKTAGKVFLGTSVSTTIIGGTGPLVISALEPANGSRFPLLSNVKITFEAAEGNGIRQFDLYRDGALLSSLLSPPYSLVLSNLRAGTYQITGLASDYFDGTAATNITFIVDPPVNDNFTNRILLNGALAYADGVNMDATVETGEPNHDGFWKNNSIWWTWTAPADGQLTLDSTGSDFVHLLGLYRGSTLTNLYALALAKNDPGPNRSIFTRDVQAGTNYQIVVDGGYPFTEGHVKIKLDFDYAPTASIVSPGNGVSISGPTNLAVSATAFDMEGQTGQLDLWIDNFAVATNFGLGSVDFRIPNIAGGTFALTARATDSAAQQRTSTARTINVSLVNDAFVNRVRISGYRFLGFGTTVGAGAEVGEPGDEFPFDGPRKSVWWEWTVPISANVSISADSAEYSSGVDVYTGTNVAQLTRIASHINDFGHNEVTFAAVAGAKYQISVDGFHFAGGTASGKYRLIGFVQGLENFRTVIGQPTSFQLPVEINGLPGISFALQASTNLSHWTVLTTNFLMSTKTNFQVPIGELPMQFYRAVLQP